MSKARAFVAREFKHMLPPTIFFIISFNVLVMTVEMLDAGGVADASAHLAATIAALVCGKAVLVADKLPFFNRYPEHPLIWNTAWKTGLYVLVTLGFRLIEKLIGAATGQYGFVAGLEADVAHFDWPRFIAIQIWLVILFFVYTAVGELTNQIGRERILQMFLGPVSRRGEKEA
ncbi:MAG: hypothetical protein AAFP17_15525 [Pseudomonadota bacterium]